MKKMIVVVEDDLSIRDTLNIIFSKEGYVVKHFSNGEAILKGEVDVPDLFLIDRQLTGVDGLDICRFLRKRKETSRVPIIVLSATPGMLHIAKDAGANDFIEKPFNRGDLLETVKRYL